VHFVNFAFLAALVVASVMIPLSVPAGVVCNIEFISFTAFVVAGVMVPLVIPAWVIPNSEFIFFTALVVAHATIPLAVPAGMVFNIKFVSFTAFVVASVVVPFFVPMCVWVAFLACAVTSTLNSSRMRSDAIVGASKNTFAVFTVEHLVFTAISLSQWAFVAVLLK